MVLATHLHADVDVVFHRLRLKDRPSLSTLLTAPWAWRRRSVGSGFGGNEPIEHFARVGNNIPMSGTTARRNNLQNAGGFDEEIARNDDYDMWVRLAASGARFKFIDLVLGTYANGEHRVSTRPSLGILARRRMRVKHEQFFPPHLWKMVLARFEYLDAVETLQSADPEAAATIRHMKVPSRPRYWLALMYRRLSARARKLR